VLPGFVFADTDVVNETDEGEFTCVCIGENTAVLRVKHWGILLPSPPSMLTLTPDPGRSILRGKLELFACNNGVEKD